MIHHKPEDHVEDELIFKAAQDRGIRILSMNDFLHLLAERLVSYRARLVTV